MERRDVKAFGGVEKIKLISKFHMTELEISLQRIFKVTAWICLLENQTMVRDSVDS
jgi:hypothetical protein